MSYRRTDAAAYLRPLTDEAVANALDPPEAGAAGPTARTSAALAQPGKTLLTDALEHVIRKHWSGARSEETMASQGLGAIKGLHSLGVYHVDDVTPDKIREAVRAWLAEGYSASTVRKRLTAISFMGAPVEGCLPKLPKPLQWWLNPSYRAKAVAHLRDTATMAPHGDARLVLADYIEWVCVTGLRVEESLRLRWRDITFCPRDPRLPEDMYVLIPGTKTVASQATLPLSREAGEILLRRRNADPAAGPAGLVFPAKYRVLSTLWNECRGVLGVSDVPTATLKSFRRTAARYLHVERNMPLDVTRQYLRHSSVHTTTGYLRLVGGYSAEEMKRWL